MKISSRDGKLLGIVDNETASLKQGTPEFRKLFTRLRAAGIDVMFKPFPDSKGMIVDGVKRVKLSKETILDFAHWLREKGFRVE